MNRREFLAAAAAAPLALRFGANGLAAPLRPLALVTADREARIVAVDPIRGRTRAVVATLPGPRSIESVAGRNAIVAHTAEGAVTLIEAAPLSVRRVLRGFGQPRYTAARFDARYAYVTDSGLGDVAVIDVRHGRVVHRTELAGPARHITLDPAGRVLWVALGFSARTIALLDVAEPARPRLVRSLRPPFHAHDVGFTPDGRRVWVTSGDSRRIGVYDARTLRMLFTLTADAPPQHVTFASGRAFVTSGDDGTLHVHALGDGRVLRSVEIPIGSYNVQQGPGGVLTPSLHRGTLCVLDGRGRLVQRVQAARSSHDACFVDG
jgi:DNA-binding beta-propeller fold protein YncE